MLVNLRLRNYRGFADHELTFRATTVIVGRNNAGKSTIVEALRLVAVVTSRFPNLNFHDVPKWLNAPKLYRGVAPDVSREGFNFDTAFHRYDAPPAVITATFENRCRVEMYVGPDSALHAVVFDAAGRPVPDKARARRVTLPLVAILPQIRPLQESEEVLSQDYVRSAQDTPLSSMHFRNQLRLDPRSYVGLRKMVESSWPGVRVRELTSVAGVSIKGTPHRRELLQLMIRNDDFVAEAGAMGHGLQMWLQTMWFLARTPVNATVILDEPDVYMHPDLQRRLLRLVTGRHSQTVIATHSTEIISDVDPSSVLVVERNAAASQFATSIPEVQNAVESLGGVHNLSLARLWSARRFLVVEGDDIDLLGPIHQVLFPGSALAIQSMPHGDVGGWSGWERAIGAATAMRRAFGNDLKVYAIFDSDFHAETVIQSRYSAASKHQLELHIWRRKEIENYLIVPRTIARVIASRCKTDGPAEEVVAKEVARIVDALRMDTTAAMVDAQFATDKAAGAAAAYRQAEEVCNRAFATPHGAASIVSGKVVLSRLSEWAKREFNVSFSPRAVARAIRSDEVAAEVARVVQAIEEANGFDSAWRSAR